MNRMLPVPEGLTGLRTDVGLAELLGLSRAKADEILTRDGMTMGETILKKSDALRSEEALEVTAPVHPKIYVPEVTSMPGLKPLYEDADLVVVDRPAEIATHTGSGWDGPTMIGTLRVAEVQISTSGPVEYEGTVHRLDAGTSGAVVVARSELAHGKLKSVFRYYRVEKVYLAVARGILKPSPGTIDAPIGRVPGCEFKMAVVVGGKPAVTHYDTAEDLPDTTLARVQLETGRTHQIRVYFTAIGHPLLGNTGYGADAKRTVRLDLERQWLHASRLVFKHPRTGIEIVVDLPLPFDLQGVLAVLRGS